ncbi:C39 family peptidase [Candidatus Woesearchaeota archaeon]|nr:C39 family peptidase [Candidatus Woesearchaeota archaeon]
MKENMETRTKDSSFQLPVGNYRQPETGLCGPAALKTILDSHGSAVSIDDIAQLSETNHLGTSPKKLCAAASTLGYKVFQRMNATLDDVETYLRAGLLVLVAYQEYEGRKPPKNPLLDEGHYVVIYGFNDKELLISDPAKETGGYRRMPKELFFKQWHDHDELEDKLYKQWFMTVFPEQMPFIQAEGTNYDVGVAIGEKLKKDVMIFLVSIQQDYERLAGKSFCTFISAAQKFLSHCKERYPEYVSEIEGMAAGTGIDFKTMFALSCTEELDWTAPNKSPEKCSTLIARVEDNVVIAHNEDYLMYPAQLHYVLRAKQKGKPSFLAVGYVGSLAGSSAGINSKGIAMAGNSITARDCKIGVIKNFVCRAILDQENIKLATKTISETERAVGGNYTLVSSRQQRFIETTANQKKILPIKTLPAYHTNHCLSKELSALTNKPSCSSRLRYNRLKKILRRVGTQELTFDELKQIMSNHADYPSSICRHEYETDERNEGAYTTLASIIINTNTRTLHIAQGNPCIAKYKEYSL